MTISELTNKIFENYQAGAVSDDNLVQIIELASGFLNLKTLSNYAKTEKISYNGAKKRNKKTVKIDGVEFIINND